MRKVLLIFIGMFVMLMTLSGCSKSSVKIGSGKEGGNYYTYASMVSQMVNEKSDVEASVRVTAGSLSNVRLLAEGFVDVAMVQADVFKDAIDGKGEFSEGRIDNIHSVLRLYTESIQVVVPAGSSYKSVGDLKGKRISVGEMESGTLSNALDVLKAYGIEDGDYEASYLSFNDSALALKNGEIDALFMTSSYPTSSLVELSSSYSFRFLNVDSEALINEELGYSVNVIPSGTYPGQTEDITTIGVDCLLVANDNLDKSVEDVIVGILEESNSEIQKVTFGKGEIAKKPRTRGTLKIDMYLTLGIAVLALYLGSFLKKRVQIFEKFCIPSPVIGGIIVAVITCILYATGLVEFVFDETLKNVCMIIFFTSVGFQANIKVLKKGGVKLVLFLVCVVGLIFMQNVVSVLVAMALGESTLMGMTTGSISMIGGHGTAGAFGIILEDLGEKGAITLSTTAATFGLIAGSLMGGPVGNRLIKKHKLNEKMEEIEDSVLVENDSRYKRMGKYAEAAYLIAIAMGLGSIVSFLLSKTGMTFPTYIGAMIIAAIIRNVSEYKKGLEVPMGEINDLGGICLSLFLGIAMVTLKLWQLADCALPLLVMLVAQTLLMFIFAYFIVFNVMGRNYDAAVLSSGICGFGMGATPNAMANMQSVTQKYGPSITAFILVPIVGSMFADFINSLVITLFLNIL